MPVTDELSTLALHRACADGDAAAARSALADGVSPDRPLDATGTTPLMAAASVDVVGTLLDAGASVAPLRFGRDVLDVVVSDLESSIADPADRLEAARLLLDHGCRLDRRDPQGWPRLYVAAFASDPGAVELLLTLGAPAEDRPSPLGAACWGTVCSGRTAAVVDLLVGAGADLEEVDAAGWTLLHAASMPYGHGSGFESSDGPNPEAITALIRHGHPVDPVGPGGTTPLMLAAGAGDPDAVALLRAAGANPRLRDHSGRSAGDLARDTDCRIAELLDDLEHDPDAAGGDIAALAERQTRAARCADLLADP